jgi:8-oxo-dGTP diphosphatase
MNVTVIAKVVIQDSNNNILVLRRSPTDTNRPGTWDLPGGEVETGEDPSASAVREVLEETGLQVQEMSPLFVCADNEPVYRITLIFKAPYTSGEIKLSFEHDDFKWISPENFNAVDIPEKYKRAVSSL